MLRRKTGETRCTTTGTSAIGSRRRKASKCQLVPPLINIVRPLGGVSYYPSYNKQNRVDLDHVYKADFAPIKDIPEWNPSATLETHAALRIDFPGVPRADSGEVAVLLTHRPPPEIHHPQMIPPHPRS